MATESSDISLLFRIRADAAGVKTGTAEAKAAVAQLRQSFGPQLTQSVTVANKAFSEIGDNLNNFVAQRVPLVGGAIGRITDALRNAGSQGGKTDKAITGVAKSIESIATQSGRSVPQIASFLTKFVQIEGQAQRDKAAVDFFGASLGTKLIPELEKTGTALAGVAAEGAGTGAAMTGMAGPIGIVVAAVVALHIAAGIAAKEIFDLTRFVANFRDRMNDLSAQTNLTVSTLSALEALALKTGGSLEAITQAIVLFQRKLDEAQDPLSKTAELFNKFGIETSDTETSLRSAFNALAAMPPGFAQINAAAELFGARGGKQVLAILKETNGDLDATIDQLRELGLLITDDSARAAGKLNDEFDLLNLQFRALAGVAVNDLIPAITELLRNFSDLLQAVRPVVAIFGRLASIAIRPVVEFTKGLSLAVKALTGDYVGLAKAIKAASDANQIPALKVPEVGPVPLPGAPSAQQAASDALNQADAVLAIVKRTVAEKNQILAESFQRGRIDRQREVDSIIAANARVLKAETDRIDAQLAQRVVELEALDEAQKKRGEIINRDTDAYRSITTAIGKLQQERLDKENLFNVTSREIRARAAQERADAIRNQIQNETDITLSEFDRQIKAIEAQIQRGDLAEETGLTTIEQLEQEKINVRVRGLERQKEVGFLTVEAQREIDEEIKKLNQERDRLTDEQNNRRLDRERAAGQRAVEIAIANIDTLIQLEQIAGQRRIDTIQALADQRVISEQEAARQILRIRLDLIDDEIEATRTKLKAAASIADKDERIRTQADLNNQLRILNEQRRTIQAEGNRAIEDGRREDLKNERRYADELEDIYDRIRRIEFEAAEEVIRLMIASFARRKDIIRAQRDLDLAEEEDRHRRVTESIRQQKAEIDAEIRLLTQRLDRLKVGTAEEIEEHDRLVASLEKLRAARAALDDQQRVEDDRTKTRKRRVTTDADRDEEEADPLGRLELDTERLQEFARTLEDTIVPLNEILASSFHQVSDAIGQTVASWVLLGETGPGVMRKILAQALASLAAEAAVNAIKELALGFATLFFNPAESAAHFTAAGLWASIGGVAAIAGRGIAGDLFKQKSGAASGGSSDGRSGELNPLSLARNAGPGSQQQIADQIRPINITVKVVPDGTKFGSAVTAHVVEDVNNAGPIREVLAGDGNLNRG